MLMTVFSIDPAMHVRLKLVRMYNAMSVSYLNRFDLLYKSYNDVVLMLFIMEYDMPSTNLPFHSGKL